MKSSRGRSQGQRGSGLRASRGHICDSTAFLYYHGHGREWRRLAEGTHC